MNVIIHGNRELGRWNEVLATSREEALKNYIGSSYSGDNFYTFEQPDKIKVSVIVGPCIISLFELECVDHLPETFIQKVKRIYEEKYKNKILSFLFPRSFNR